MFCVSTPNTIMVLARSLAKCTILQILDENVSQVGKNQFLTSCQTIFLVSHENLPVNPMLVYVYVAKGKGTRVL